jgi:hypothetical protein
MLNYFMIIYFMIIYFMMIRENEKQYYKNCYKIVLKDMIIRVKFNNLIQRLDRERQMRLDK